jgi:hypothetical protein
MSFTTQQSQYGKPWPLDLTQQGLQTVERNLQLGKQTWVILLNEVICADICFALGVYESM